MINYNGLETVIINFVSDNLIKEKCFTHTLLCRTEIIRLHLKLKTSFLAKFQHDSVEIQCYMVDCLIPGHALVTSCVSSCYHPNVLPHKVCGLGFS